MMDSAASVQLVRESDAQDSVRKTVGAGLNKFDGGFAPEVTFEPLVLKAVDSDDTIIGGLVGQTCRDWRWAHIAMLWVAERHRIQGIGRQLLGAAEVEAVCRGCSYVQLETFSYGARGFYEKQGYLVFGVQENFPPGHRRFYLRKTLD
jgi:ribosomal protein S18 acetylase RimI-like enzyme